MILLSCRLHYYYCRCLKDLGATHGGIASALVPSLLSTHPFLMTSEPNIDDPACILATAYSNVCAQAMHARLVHLVIHILYIKYSCWEELYIEYSCCEELYIKYSCCEVLYIKYSCWEELYIEYSCCEVLYIKYSSCEELYIKYSCCEELYIEYSSCEELYIKSHSCEEFCYS